jgi:dihydroflavonol-4-reductase
VRSTMTLVEKLRKGTRFHPPGSNAVVDARDVAICMRQLMEHGGTGERHLLTGENITYRDLFAKFSRAFGNRPPDMELPAAVLKTGWRLERLRTFITRGTPLLTRSTAHSAIISRRYSNKKTREILGIEFRDADAAIANVAAYLESRAIRSAEPV